MTVKATCVKVALPEAFSLPRKFGISWGCFTQGAFYGLDAVVAEGGVKGLYFRYVLSYDANAKRYMAEYGQRERRWAASRCTATADLPGQLGESPRRF